MISGFNIRLIENEGSYWSSWAGAQEPSPAAAAAAAETASEEFPYL